MGHFVSSPREWEKKIEEIVEQIKEMDRQERGTAHSCIDNLDAPIKFILEIIVITVASNLQLNMTFLKLLPSGHITFIQHRLNVDATS